MVFIYVCAHTHTTILPVRVHKTLYSTFIFRYAFTVLSNISVYGIAWFLFSSVGSDQLGEEDKAGFMVESD